ncbi:hypothetical protein IV203_034477 [Nitzschia inconspicua]|uniref:Uncharacterized protein n=1 Tax=Nitzschia inconspicua TaxID=303405 RepID=A0A9K3LCV0_9STRA|nr:hypothetical protein IV203_002534 [Nitzschia inconspicua]KAG7359379.1 hypothetical protein IV203_034477 [Nitzschia inconspicua]
MLEAFKKSKAPTVDDEDIAMEAVARRFGEGDSIPPGDPLFKNLAQKELFDHMCDRACEMSWEESNREVSQYLNVEMSKKQQKLVNPSYKNVLMGFMCYDIRGGGAKKKIAQRRLNIVDGNVNSYARCLNDPRRLAAMREMDQLISAVAQVAADQAREKVERKEVAAAKAKERKKKQAEEAAADTKKRDELKPALEAIMAKFVSGEKTAPAGCEEMSKSQLVNILKYFYDEKPRGLATMGKNKLVAHVMKFYDPSHSA